MEDFTPDKYRDRVEKTVETPNQVAVPHYSVEPLVLEHLQSTPIQQQTEYAAQLQSLTAHHTPYSVPSHIESDSLDQTPPSYSESQSNGASMMGIRMAQQQLYGLARGTTQDGFSSSQSASGGYGGGALQNTSVPSV